MPSYRKPAITALAAVLTAAQAFAQAGAGKKNAAREGKEEGKAKKYEDDPLDLPIPKGQPQKGVKFPLYDTEGRLRMRFEIGVGTWVDDDNIKMSKLRIETFKEDGTPELDMDLPDAVLNKRTKELTSQVAVHVKRDDFEITGNSMSFNLDTRAGKLGGGVKMTIFNLQEQAGGKPREKKTTIELKPAPTDDKEP